jgi:NAD(P)H-hydrate epimerase
MRTPERALTAAQMREADRRCIEDLGIPGAVLMERAGLAVYDALPPGPIAVLCGTGNNGGDGFVVARHALLAGRLAAVWVVGNPARIRGDAALQRDIFLRLGGRLSVAQDEAAAGAALEGLRGAAVLVDALLGTGFEASVRGPIRAAIAAWPGLPTVAVDLPSGLNADTGEPGGLAVRATTTVTFQYPKTGFANPAAAPYLGRVIVADIGIPAVCADDAAWAALRARTARAD